MSQKLSGGDNENPVARLIMIVVTAAPVVIAVPTVPVVAMTASLTITAASITSSPATTLQVSK